MEVGWALIGDVAVPPPDVSPPVAAPLLEDITTCPGKLKAVKVDIRFDRLKERALVSCRGDCDGDDGAAPLVLLALLELLMVLLIAPPLAGATIDPR